MAVYVTLEESDCDGCEQSKDNVSSSSRQKDLDTWEPKIYSILLVLILLINTAIVIAVAMNNTSNKVSIENKNDSYGYYGLSDLSSEPLMILDNSTTDDNYMKNEQNQYILFESVDETITVPEEDNQIQDDYQS